MTSIWQLILSRIHHTSPDWIMWDSVFVVGGVLAGFGYWRQSKISLREQSSDIKPGLALSESRLKILSAHWGVEGALGGDPDKVDCLLEKQTGNIFTARVCGDLFHGSIPADGKLRLKVKYSFDGHEDTVVRQDGEYLMLPEDPYLKAKLEKFRPLQLEALDIERDIGLFLKEIGPRPALTAPGAESGWNSWYTRLTIGYKNQFAPRIEKLLLSSCGEIRAPRLGLDGSGIRNEKELHAVRLRLISFAYEQDGLLLEAKE